MTTAQTMLQRDRTEEEFVAELETESTQELAQFLAGAWTASLFSPQAIEELYQALGQKRAEEEFVAVLKTKSTQELAQFLAGSWTASLFSSQAIEELYQALQGKQACEPERVEEDAVEMSQD